MYGTQTRVCNIPISSVFENDVKMYGTQTTDFLLILLQEFENDVKMYGTQTLFLSVYLIFCLRMM